MALARMCVFVFMPSQPTLHRTSEALCFCLDRRGFCSFRAEYNLFVSLRKTTERISMKFAGNNQYNEQIK